MGKASIEEQTETYADGKQKGLFAAINATTTYGNYLELLPYTLCIMTLYTLGFKQPSKADLDIMKVPSCTYQPLQPNCTKLRYVTTTVTLKQIL